MAQELPMACTLNAADFAQRREWIERLGSSRLRRAERTAAGARFHLEDDERTEAELRRLIAAEAQCCPFLHFDLRAEDGEIVLEVSGPEGARPLIDAFFEPEPA